MLFSEPLEGLSGRAACLAKRLWLLPRSFRPRRAAWQSNGQAGPGRDFVYLGEGESLNHLLRLYPPRAGEMQTAPLAWPFWPGQAAGWQRRGAIVFVEMNRLLAFMMPRGGFKTFPWLRQVVRLKSAEYVSRKASIEATFGRKVRRSGYGCLITTDDRAVTRFHEEYYAPYIKQRFEENARLRSLRQLRLAVRSGFVVQVLEGPKWVAGAVCRLWAGRLIVLALGLKPDYAFHLRRGALSAVYYFVMRWAEERSLTTVDLLRARPHAGDGVFEHKRRWGAECQMDPWPHTVLGVLLPPSAEPPARLREHLVWTGQRFVALGELISTPASPKSPPCPGFG